MCKTDPENIIGKIEMIYIIYFAFIVIVLDIIDCAIFKLPCAKIHLLDVAQKLERKMLHSHEILF